MATVIVERLTGGKDRHGDPLGQTVSHSEPGARVAWAGATEDLDHKSVLVTSPTVYFKRRSPDIRRGDTLKVLGRELRVKDIQPWEHPRRESIIMGTAVICEEIT
ncbi:hypothetical protein CKALI_11295 [Corynebacterium kalinowskii]|uniref:Head-tail adaptor protein n=1 Tax=Corynebacterium kalinowskii TaxID=2675216 RepID=A0A6B8VG40_9CORY|nr:hypothetical protein [Corynebacterium kalinowskii]QGU03103.1 hypothetical protein CKALI_11295 [Corynebacterium kalinowskii]